MVQMKSTRELVVGDRVEVDDQSGVVTESHPSGPHGWAVSIKDPITGKVDELDIDPTDVDVPIWEVHNVD